MRFDEVVEQIRCPDCWGTGTDGGAPCGECNGSGINPGSLEEASGWGTWAMSVHDNPGWFVSVYLGLIDPTGHAEIEDGFSARLDEPSI